MPLTTAQLTTLKTDILANAGEFGSIPNTSDGAFTIAAAYNALASPTFIVWRTDIPTKDVKKSIVWTEYIGRSSGEQNAFTFMLSNGTINGGDPNIRQGIQDIFSGPSGATTRANLVALAKRSATRAEKLFATGTGSDASPGTLTFEGSLSYQDVLTARSLA
jgi:hypothetical protein